MSAEADLGTMMNLKEQLKIVRCAVDMITSIVLVSNIFNHSSPRTNADYISQIGYLTARVESHL